MAPSKTCTQCGGPLTRGLQDFARALSSMRDDARAEAEALADKHSPPLSESDRKPYVSGAEEAALRFRSNVLVFEMGGICERCAHTAALKRQIERWRSAP